VRWDQVTNPPAEDLLVRLDPVTGAEYRAAGDVVVAVVDTGPGLSLEQQQQMFREGVQFNANELQAGQGSGLGLWISREIMKQHGGVISVSSEGLGKGSTFTITVPVLLPLVSKDRVTNSGPQQFKRSASLTMERGDVLSVEIPRRVLIVDDAVSSVKILNRLLVNAGMEVTNAYDGSEGIDRVNQCPHETMFDLIIMDFEMPIMNGPEATRTLRNAGHRMPIIGVTGNVLPEDRDYFLACGADWVLPKPLNMTALLNAYSDVVAERREEAHQQTTADAEDDSPA
jgi:CheY-like chemotaxis protein